MTNKYEQAAKQTIYSDIPEDVAELIVALLRAAAKLKPGVDAAKILEMYAAGKLVERPRDRGPRVRVAKNGEVVGWAKPKDVNDDD